MATIFGDPFEKVAQAIDEDLGNFLDDLISLENKTLLAKKRRRELAEPSVAQRWAIDKETQQSQFLFSKLFEVAKDPNLNESKRKNLQAFLEAGYYGFNEQERAILEPMLKGTTFDPQVKKEQYWEENFGHLKPQKPTVGSGTEDDPYRNVDLPDTPENESQLAAYQLRMGEYNYNKMRFLHGKEKAEGFKPPEFIQPFPVTGEGDKQRPGDMFRINPKTNQIERIKAIAAENLAFAEKEGWTLSMIKEKNFVPLQKAMTGTFQGQSFRVTSGTDLLGKPKIDVQTYGTAKAETSDRLSKVSDIISVFGALRAEGKEGFDRDKLQSHPLQLGLYDTLKELETSWTKKPVEEFKAELSDVNRWLQGAIPNFPYVLSYDADIKKSFFGDKNVIKIDGSNWMLIPATKKVTFADGTTLYWDANLGRASDATGKDVPELAGQEPNDGDPLPPGVVSMPGFAGGKGGRGAGGEFEAPKMTLGDVYTVAAEYFESLGAPLSKANSEYLSKQIKSKIDPGKQVTITSEDIKHWAKQIGVEAQVVAGFIAEMFKDIPEIEIPFTGA